MYELVVKDFKELPTIIHHLTNEQLNFFCSNFGTIAISESIDELLSISSSLPKNIKTQIIRYKKHNLPPHRQLTDIKIYRDRLELNTEIVMPLKDILAISVEAIKKPLLRKTTLQELKLEDIFFDELEISFKIITPMEIFYTDNSTRFYSYTPLFELSESYDRNIKKLIHFLKSLNHRLLLSPMVDIYLSMGNYIKYFINDLLTSKEILWMKKLKVIDI